MDYSVLYYWGLMQSSGQESFFCQEMYINLWAPAVSLSICLSAAITIPVALSGSFTQLAMISTISRFSQYIPTCLAVIAFRRRGMKSTFQIPFGYFLPLLASGVIIWLLANADKHKLLVGLGAMAVIVPIYFVMKWYNKMHGYVFKDAE